MKPSSVNPEEVEPSNKVLWAVKSYLDLITKDYPLVPGSGLKILYAMTAGVDTLNTQDIAAIARKSQHLGLMHGDLLQVMNKGILTNLYVYGLTLQQIIFDRISAIGYGEVKNPEGSVKYSQIEARRAYYVPTPQFILRLKKALWEDTGYASDPVVTLADIVNDADSIMMRMSIDEGHIAPSPTSWGALIQVVEDLVSLLERESLYAVRDYKERARHALKILWFIGKLLLGDLTLRQDRTEINAIDLEKRINITDGTLAAIPFPTQKTVEVFCDDDCHGMTFKASVYLQAVSAASFYRGLVNER